MKTPGQHPRHRLDEVIHAPVRLSIVSALASADRIDFGVLRDLVEVSDSLLSKHISILEEAGYIEVVKGYVGKRPRTWLRLSPSGQTTFHEYVSALRQIVARTVSLPPRDGGPAGSSDNDLP